MVREIQPLPSPPVRMTVWRSSGPHRGLSAQALCKYRKLLDTPSLHSHRGLSARILCKHNKSSHWPALVCVPGLTVGDCGSLSSDYRCRGDRTRPPPPHTYTYRGASNKIYLLVVTFFKDPHNRLTFTYFHSIIHFDIVALSLHNNNTVKKCFFFRF